MAITAALGVMSSAGSPCCSSPTRTAMGMRPRIDHRDGGGVIALPDGGLTIDQCEKICGVDADKDEGRQSTTWYDCEPIGSSNQVECVKVYDVCRQAGGRRPQNHRDEKPRGTTRAGAFFAAIAELEAASVDAFGILAVELTRFGAPAWMRVEALRAASDESRHAPLVAALARSRGGVVRTPRRTRASRRSLVDFACENAVEGRTRETFGALLAWHQAIHAEDADVRDAMRSIAPDETRHAALASAIHEWAMRRLRPEQRESVEAARQRACEELLGMETTPNVGLPSSRAMQAMAAELFTRL